MKRRWIVRIELIILIIGAAVALGRREIDHFSAVRIRRGTAIQTTRLPIDSLLIDPVYVHDGSVLNSRDIRFRCDRLRRSQQNLPERLRSRQVENTIVFLQRGRDRYPEAIRFKLRSEQGQLSLLPLDWRLSVPVKREIKRDIVIIGGELESVVLAMRAADRGLSVALVYAGPMGGLSSDSGGNLRYVDGVAAIPRPAEQVRLFRSALGMAPSNLWSLPIHVSSRLDRYLRISYTGRISLFPTRTYDSLQVERVRNSIASITTEEGIRLMARSYLDTDPECRTAEKAGVPFSIDTPNISYGMVFDVAGLRAADWRRTERVTPERVLKLAGVRSPAIAAGSAAFDTMRRLDHDVRSERNRVFTLTRTGYASLADGFNLWMELLAIRHPSPGLLWLNRRRRASGYNISESGDRATFNSLSYHFDVGLLQEDHSLARDPMLRPFPTIEIPALEVYLRAVCGNPALRVIMPQQFYVRKATASFETLQPYGDDDFVPRPRGPFWMAYWMDLRDLEPRDHWEEATIEQDAAARATVRRRVGLPGGEMRWNCRASAARTRVANLYLVSKSSMTPRWFGGLRILQNLMGTGVLLVDELARSQEKSGLTLRSSP